VKKARSLTNQILTFSRQLEQEKVQVNVWQVLFETISFVSSSVPRNIQIKDNTYDSDIQVVADPTQLFRVFLNLLTNSIQAMEKTGGTVTIDTALFRCDELKSILRLEILAEDYVMISITDTGVGMDESLMDRIFEPFFTTKEMGKGNGLGLSVVHGIISEMGGEISVSSKLGEGTTFRVYIPIMKGETSFSNNNIAGTKLLFISGNRFESRVLSIALKNAGYSISLACNSKEVLSELSKENERPQLIIFPDDLPDFSFYDLLSVMKKVKGAVPLILITDSQDLILKESLLISGFVKHFLIKPVSLREVKTAIEISLTGN
jgi:CheY-like chemotaxis protein